MSPFTIGHEEANQLNRDRQRLIHIRKTQLQMGFLHKEKTVLVLLPKGTLKDLLPPSPIFPPSVLGSSSRTVPQDALVHATSEAAFVDFLAHMRYRGH